MRLRLILLLVGACCFAGCARMEREMAKTPSKEVKVTSDRFVQGISAWQVFTRHGKKGDITFSTATTKTLTAEVVRDSDKKVIRKQKWELPESRKDDKPVSLAITGIPFGGEYTVRFENQGRANVFNHILVGDIWVVGGQSNAVGPEAPIAPAVSGVHYYKGEWKAGRGMLFPTFDKEKPNRAPFSAWRPAAEEYYRRTGIPVGLMGWAFGGVPMKNFWDKKFKELPVYSMVPEHGRGATTYLYYQGEHDCMPDRIPVYQDRLTSMVAVLRRYTGNPDLQVVIMQLSYVAGSQSSATPYCGRLREKQRQFCLNDPHAVLITAMPYPHIDTVHLSPTGQTMLGKKLGELLANKTKTGKLPWQGPRVVKAQFTDAKRTAIRVTFDSAKSVKVLDKPLGIAGSDDVKWAADHKPEMDWLVTDEKHPGFPVKVKQDPKSKPVWGPPDTLVPYTKVYQVPKRVSAKGKVVTIELTEPSSKGAKISYGLMERSLATLTDEKGVAAVTFDAVPVQEAQK